jgi:hypothetical protein
MAQQEVEIFFKVEGVDGYITDLNELSDALKSVAKEQKDVNEEIEETGKASKKGGGFLTSLGKKGKAAFGALKGAIAATGIGLLLTAFAQLVEWFKKTDAGAKILQGATAALGVIFDRILVLLQPIGEILSNLFTNPVESLKNFGNLIKENIQDRFTALVEGLGFVGEAFKKLFEGDFSGAAEAAGNAFTKIAYEASGLETVVEGVTAVVNATTEAFEGVGEEINNAITATNNLIDANNRFADLQNRLLVQNAQLTKDLEEQKKISEDTTRSYDERKAALDEVNKANEQLAENALKEAEANEELIRQKLALTQNDEDRRALQAELATATAERIAKEQEAEIVRLESAQLNRELDQEEVDRQRSINDMIEQMRAENIQDEEQQALRALELAEEAALKELETLQATEEEKQAIIEEFQKQRTATEEEYAQKRVDEANKEADEKKALEEAVLNTKLQTATAAFDAISQIAGEQSAVGKAAAVAAATINTYQAATNALANTPAPPPFPQIAAGVAIASGLLNIRKILAVQTPGVGPAVAPPTISAGATPQFQLPTAPGSAGEDIFLGGGQDGREQPIRAYVVATEVSDAQQANQQIENLSRL